MLQPVLRMVMFALHRRDWDAHEALRAELGAVVDELRVRWVPQASTVWTTAVPCGRAHARLRAIAAQWRARGVAVLELAGNEPRCSGCGCVRDLPCAGGCTWVSTSPWRCGACPDVEIVRTHEAEVDRAFDRLHALVGGRWCERLAVAQPRAGSAR